MKKKIIRNRPSQPILHEQLNLKKMTNRKLVRYIEAYDKKTEELVYKEQLPRNINIEQLKSVFYVENNDPEMIYMYDILSEHADYLMQFTKQKIDFKKYDYFLGCYEDS